jgi:class 3 adenylate cyclase
MKRLLSQIPFPRLAPRAAHEQLSRGLTLAVASLSLAAVLGCYFSSPVREAVNERVVRPIAFEVRHALRRDPPVDPRLVLYGLTDKTTAKLERSDLTPKEWIGWLRGLIPYRPRAVLFDRVWATLQDPAQAEWFAGELKALPFPVYAGAWTPPVPIASRPPLDPDRREFFLSDWTAEGPEASLALTLPLQPLHLYGPNARILPGFSAVGHLLNQGSSFEPLVRFAPRRAIPFAPLLFAKERRLKDNALWLDGTRVPLDGTWKGTLNFLHPRALFSIGRDLWGPVRALREGNEVPLVPEDAVILVNLELFTGGTDFHPSPYGRVPGVFFLASAANSVLTGRWITPDTWGWVWIVMTTILGALVGNYLPRRLVWASLPLGAALILTAGLVAFSHLGSELPWLHALAAFLLPALFLLLERARRTEKTLRRLRDSLDGRLSARQLAQLLGSPGAQLVPQARVLTVLFVDIVGFSVAAEEQTAEKAFFELKRLLGRLTDQVHAHGGVVDKTLGDGLLAFFGHSFDGSPGAKDHADQAVRCALAIQRENAALAPSSLKKGESIFPLRVGLNTASVFLGDLGNDRRVDLTVIGQGVNLAKRMESACESWKVLMGRSTRDLLQRPDDLGVTLKDRLVGIKHAAEPWPAVEVDPFTSSPELLKAALATYRGGTLEDRQAERWVVPSESALTVKTSLGMGRIENFSRSGLGIVLDRYLGRGVVLTLEIQTPDGATNDKLNASGLSPLVVEVRWGYPLQGGREFRLGVQFQGLGQTQADRLVETLRPHLRTKLKAAS